MGVFGTGLYSGDFAMDLRSSIRAVSRLPFDGDRLVEILCETEPAAAGDPADAAHSTFWLVLADQFARRGIHSARARDYAIDIIDSGTDLSTLRSLGMTSSGLNKRQEILDELRVRLLAPITDKPRPILKKPQPFLMKVGDVLIYPTSKGNSINPYYSSRKLQPNWTQDGWGVITIVARGQAFEFLSWYRPLTIVLSFAEPPTIDSLRGEILWRLERPGTCSAIHFKRIEFRKIGSFAIDETKFSIAFPRQGSGVSAAINDISIANALSVPPSFNTRFLAKPGEPLKEGKVGRQLTVLGIEHILQSERELR